MASHKRIRAQVISNKKKKEKKPISIQKVSNLVPLNLCPQNSSKSPKALYHEEGAILTHPTTAI
jgi:hypothetical protein